MKKRHICAAVGIATAAGLTAVGAAEAAQPTDPPCFGQGFAAFATGGGGLGGTISIFASNPELLPLADNFGGAIQNLQAGTAVLFAVCPPPG